MAVTIRDKSDLKLWYWYLRREEREGRGRDQKNIEVKRSVRRFLHQPPAYGPLEFRRIVRDDGMDGYVELVQLPHEMDDACRDDAVEWFMHKCWMEAPMSMYDCSGRAFSCWAKSFRRRGAWWFYHSVEFDV